MQSAVICIPCPMSAIRYDTVNPVSSSPLILQLLQCPYTKVKALPATESLEPLKLSSAYALSFKIYAHDQGHYAYDNV